MIYKIRLYPRRKMSLSQPSAHLLKLTLEVIAINSILRHVFFESKWPNLLMLKTANLENPAQYLAPDIVKKTDPTCKESWNYSQSLTGI